MDVERYEPRDALPRDRNGRVIEYGAPCNVLYYSAWHLGRVERVWERMVRVHVHLFGGGPIRIIHVRPDQLAVIGPTYEDVERDLAERAARRAESAREDPDRKPPDEW